MRFYTNKFAEDLALGTRHLNSGLKVLLLNGRRTGASVTTGGVVTIGSTTGLKVGMAVEQRDGNEAVVTTNIPSGRTILTVDSSTQFTLSGGGGCTAGSSLTLYFHPDRDFNTLDQVSGLELGQSPNTAHTGYTPGYGSSSRKTLASVAAAEDDTNDWALVTASDPTYTATFGPGWITGIALGYETGGADSSSRFVMYNSDGGFPLFVNGNAWPLNGFASNGVAQIKTT
jgi:hypothetical protein